MTYSSNWNETCPNCHAKQNAHENWVAKDYATVFEFNCTQCDCRIECMVHTVPEFEFREPESPEEYQQRRRQAIERQAEKEQQ